MIIYRVSKLGKNLYFSYCLLNSIDLSLNASSSINREGHSPLCWDTGLGSREPASLELAILEVHCLTQTCSFSSLILGLSGCEKRLD